MKAPVKPALYWCFTLIRYYSAGGVHSGALHKPPMTQSDLARKLNLMGMEMTTLIVSRIEKNQRHVCDAELLALAKALGVTMDWLCENEA